MSKGRLIGVGVGPGDPGLLTLNALEVLRSAPVIASLRAEGHEGLARRIVERHLKDHEEERQYAAPMQARGPAVEGFYDETAGEIASVLEEGRDVAFLCLGDPLFYGSFIYLLDRLRHRFAWEVVPGITSASAAAARAGRVLARRRDSFATLPAVMDLSAMSEVLERVDAAAILKVGERLPAIIAMLRRARLYEDALLLSWIGWPEERITPLPEWKDPGAPYFSLILVERAP